MVHKLLSKYESEKLLHSGSLSLNTCLKKEEEEEEEDIDSILTAREKIGNLACLAWAILVKRRFLRFFSLLEK